MTRRVELRVGELSDYGVYQALGFSLVWLVVDSIQERRRLLASQFKEVKRAIPIGILTIAITAFVWHRSVSAQVEHKPASEDAHSKNASEIYTSSYVI